MKEGYTQVSIINGLEYYLQPGRLQHEVVWELAPDLLPLWLINTDEEGLIHDRKLVERLLERNPSDIVSLASMIAGRSILIPERQHAPIICGVPYDAIQISGWGYNPLTESRLGSEATDDVLLPTDKKNYRKIRPHQTATEVFQDGQIIRLERPFLFPGAYTEREVIDKVGAEVGMWYLLEEIQRGGIPPFLSAVPIMIGRYLDLHDKEGRPAYYYANRVPYQGRRNGIFTPGMEIKDVVKNVSDAIYAPRGLRALHEMGLAHNQMVMGNFCSGPDRIPFLADLATLTRLDNTPIKVPFRGGYQLNSYVPRGSELGKILLGVFTISEGLNQLQLLGLIAKTIQFYLMTYCLPNLNLNADQRAIFNQVLVDPSDTALSFALSLSSLEKKGIFLPARDIPERGEHSMIVIDAWREYIKNTMT